MGGLQIDNQRYNTAYPVTLWQNANSAPEMSFFSFQMERDISFNRSFAYMKMVKVTLAPFSLRLDEESGEHVTRPLPRVYT